MNEEAMSHLQVASNGAAGWEATPCPLHRLLMEEHEALRW